MTNDSEPIALRATVIGGQRYADDFTVIWRRLPIGRIMKSSGVPHNEAQWSWNCYVYGRPSRADDSGTGADIDECKAEFKNAWARIRAGLTEADVARAYRYAASKEALARYGRKRGT
jgi:hypothetical protein